MKTLYTLRTVPRLYSRRSYIATILFQIKKHLSGCINYLLKNIKFSRSIFLGQAVLETGFRVHDQENLHDMSRS